MTITTLAIDCMGGDSGPSTMVQAACQVLTNNPDLHLTLVGDEDQIRANLSRLDQIFLTRLSIHGTDEVVSMEDMPSKALRQKPNSSMAVAIELVAQGKAQAVVSAGNTGALMAFSRKILSMVPGISRPAIISSLPTDKQTSRLIDLGANVDCSPEQMVQFAQMGAAITMANSPDATQRPTVALVNVGSESIKGNEQTRKTHELMQTITDIDYRGFIEGNEVFKGDIDVIVCDGFVGNVLIKASEGVVQMIVQRLREEFHRNIWRRLLAVISISVLKSFSKSVDPDRHNGASLVGLKGVVIKSHGAANVRATVAAIEEAVREANYNTPYEIQKRLGQQIIQSMDDNK